MILRLLRTLLCLLLTGLASGCVAGLSISDATTVAGQQATIAALQTQLAAVLSATAEPSVTPSPSATPLATASPTSSPTPEISLTPSRTPSPTPTPASPFSPCNQAEFVRDLTYPDGTEVYVNTAFVKTWRLRNTGTCTWTPEYWVVLVSGDAPGGVARTSLGTYVSPGQTLDLSVSLVAPAVTGSLEGFYKLEGPNGDTFGVGTRGDQALKVSLLVGTPPFVKAVTHVSLKVDTVGASVLCPPGYSFKFVATIETNYAGKVSFHWIFSDGTTSPVQTLEFTKAGTQSVLATWNLGISGVLPSNPYGASASLYIDEPNHQIFGPQAVAIACTYITPAPTTGATSNPTITPTKKGGPQ